MISDNLILFKNTLYIIIMKTWVLIFTGFVIGLWTAWPGIVIPNNWICFKDIIVNADKDKISLKLYFALSPKYLLKGKNYPSKLRIINDACFR